jgi:membrane protein implicated in regulation of membrane protease activity
MQLSEIINAIKDVARAYLALARIYLAEVDIFVVIFVVLSIAILVVLALRYKKRRRKMKELIRQRKMLTARLNELTGKTKDEEIRIGKIR